jgi:hypothetical protein
MRRVLAAGIAELGELEPAGGRLLVLGGGVVPVLALRTLQGDDLAHWFVLLDFGIGQPPRLASSLSFWLDSDEPAHLTRRDTGLIGPCCQILNCASEEERSGHARPHLLSTKSWFSESLYL